MSAFVQSAFGQAMPEAEVPPGLSLPPTPPVVISFADTTRGDTLVVFVGTFSSPYGGDPSIAVSDSQGNTYAPIANSNPSARVQGSNYGYGQMFLASNIKGGANTITITESNTHGSGMQVQVNEYAGAWILDQSTGEFQNIGTGPFGNGSIVTPTVDGDILVGFISIMDPSNGVATTNSGWTQKGQASGGSQTRKEDAPDGDPTKAVIFFPAGSSLAIYDQELGAGTLGTPFTLTVDTSADIGSYFGDGLNLAIAALKIDSTVTPLIDVVTDICERAGLDSSEIDVSLLTNANFPTLGNAVLGYLISHPTAASQILKNLMDAYFFDACETGGKMTFVPRGLASKLTIPEADLGLMADRCKIIEQEAQSWDLPQTVTVLYNDPDLDYQQGKQHKGRNVRLVKTKQQEILTIPLTLTSTMAKQISDIFLYLQWLEKSSYNFNLWKAFYSLLDPTDVVQFIYESNTFEMRIVEDTVGAGLAISLAGKNQNTSAFLSVAVPGQDQGGGTGTGGSGGGVQVVGPTTLFLFDIPLLRDVDSNPQNTGYYLAMASAVPGWTSASLYEATDGVDYVFEESSSLNTTFGFATTILGPPRSPWTWDNVNTLTVKLTVGSFASATALQVLNGSNAILVGQELIQFTTATANSDGTVTLSGLLRGRRGTEWASATHAANELVIMPATGFLRIPQSLAEALNKPLDFKAVTTGATLTSTTSVETLTIAGNDLKPYAVTWVRSSRNPAGSLTIEWTRRTRVGWSNLSQDPVPLSEDSEQYSIDILNGSGAVVRTILATSPIAFYSATDQTTDFGSPQASIRANIYQLSAQVGRGFAKAATV